MSNYKKEILGKICYTDLVYGRINKKLSIDFSKDEIEDMIYTIISETDASEFNKKGKNIYIINNEKNIRLTINSYTNRIITADKLNKKNEPLKMITQYSFSAIQDFSQMLDLSSAIY